MFLTLRRGFTLSLALPFVLGGLLSAASAFRPQAEFKVTPKNFTSLVNMHFQEVDTREILVQAIRDRAEAPKIQKDYEFDVPARVLSEIAGEVVASQELIYSATGSGEVFIDLSKLTAEDLRIVDGQTIINLPPAELGEYFLDVTDAGIEESVRGAVAGDVGLHLIMEAQRYGQAKMIEQTCALANQLSEVASTNLQSFVDSVEVSKPSCGLLSDFLEEGS